MSRNRRNKRTNKKVNDVLNLKTFFILVIILCIVIGVCIGINKYRRYEDYKVLAKQREELQKQTETIYSEIVQSFETSKQNIAKTDSIIRISAVGDILCGDEMVKNAYNEEQKIYDFSHMFNNVKGFLYRSDIVVGTMETNFTDEDYSGYEKYNAPKEFAKAVKQAGVNLVSICHNHSLDYGVTGLNDTKEYLEELGYYTVGTKLEEDTVLIRQIKDTKIAFLSYTYGVNNQDSKTEEELNTINIYDEKQVKKDIEYAKEISEYICVIMHWGDAISSTVNDEQNEIANYLLENGVDMILGAHPSTVQPMEIKKNSEGKNALVAYSIGTYISALQDEKAKTELVLNIELRKSGEDGEVYLSKVDYTPIYVLENGTLIDMKATATEYANGNINIVDRDTYDKLIEGLEDLNKILEQ